jgi:hypothetical protein
MSNTGFTPPPMTAPQSGGGNFDSFKVDAGSYPARLVWLIMTGTIESEYMGAIKKKKEIIFGFELPTERLPQGHSRAGEPAFISKVMTYHMGEQSNMRAFINQWRGMALTEEEAGKFDISKMISAPAVLTIVHNPSKKDASKTFANIGSIQNEASYKKMMPGFAVPPQENKSIYFSVEWLSTKEGALYSIDIFNSLPEYIQKKIITSDEWKAYTMCPHYIAPRLQGDPASSAIQQATPNVSVKQQSQPHPLGAFQQAPTAQTSQQPVVNNQPQALRDVEDDSSDLPF